MLQMYHIATLLLITSLVSVVLLDGTLASLSENVHQTPVSSFGQLNESDKSSDNATSTNDKTELIKSKKNVRVRRFVKQMLINLWRGNPKTPKPSGMFRFWLICNYSLIYFLFLQSFQVALSITTLVTILQAN